MTYLKLRNEASEIDIFGTIEAPEEGAFDVTYFVKQISDFASSTVKVNINSFGGDYQTAMSIYNILRSCGKEIITVNLGVAASAAALLFLAGDVRVASVGSLGMFHRVKASLEGNSEEILKQVEFMDKMDGQIASLLKDRTGMSDEQIDNILSNETYLTSDEMLSLGVSTMSEPALKAVAFADAKNIRNEAGFLQKTKVESPIEEVAPNGVAPIDMLETAKAEFTALQNKADENIATLKAENLSLQNSIEQLKLSFEQFKAEKQVKTVSEVFQASEPIRLSNKAATLSLKEQIDAEPDPKKRNQMRIQNWDKLWGK